MAGLKHSHIIVHRQRKSEVEKHRAALEAHKKKGPLFAAAVERLLGDLEEVESCLSNRSAATSSTGSNATG